MSKNNQTILKKFTPHSPGTRALVLLKKATSKNEKFKSLCSKKISSFGRDNSGHISSRCKKAGNKKIYREVDFKRNLFEVPAKVVSTHYDPNRSSDIALIKYETGDYAYILQPEELKAGDTVINSKSTKDNDLKIGSRFPLSEIPVGTLVNSLEIKPNKGAQLVRAAGTFARISGREGSYSIIKMPSGETRKILSCCMATIGLLSNKDLKNVSLGKAGRNSWKGKRPIVRGEAKNPVDHPHGGRTRGGRNTVSFSGIRKGTKTRKNKRTSKMIVVNRKKYA